jgi:hypothetical protein
MRHNIVLVALAAVSTLTGCSMFQRGPRFQPVSEADFGRLSPAQMGPVDSARGELFSAHDAVARAKLRLQEVQQEPARARADETAARAELQRAGAELDAAASSADPGAKARAKELDAAARLRAQAARAHTGFAQRQVDARQAEVDMGEARVEVAEAELERAKLTALRQARIAAATKYDAAPFDAHVAQAEKGFQDARARAAEAARRSDQSRFAWSTLTQQYQARVQGESPPAGTGAGQALPVAPPPPPPALPPASPPAGASASGTGQ